MPQLSARRYPERFRLSKNVLGSWPASGRRRPQSMHTRSGCVTMAHKSIRPCSRHIGSWADRVWVG